MKINKSITFIIKIYILVLSIFSIFRIILFVNELNRLDFGAVEISTIMQAFLMGVRFDTVITGYIMLLPALVLFIMEIARKKNSVVMNVIFYWIFILFSVAFMIAAADVPYFHQFYDRFSIGAFEWIENFGFVVSMIVQEPQYVLFTIPFFVLDIIFFIILKRIFKNKKETGSVNIAFNIVVSVLFLGLMFLGVRGRIEKKSPIRVGTAYFCDVPFLNKLGLNPVFTLMRSFLDSTKSENAVVNLMEKDIAESKIKAQLNIKTAKYKSAIARDVKYDTTLQNKPNIVFIIMESMTAAKMTRHGNTHNLTPFLDSISYNSLYFENVYSAGKHTFNGIFSTLFSFPALYRQHTMKVIRQYDGIGETLLKNGYSTTYFTTHDSQFDNVEGFLRANNFKNIISQKDYPMSEVKTTLGVPDDYMFRYSIPVINDLAKQQKPFFVAMMTASDHGPFYIPSYFKPHNEDVNLQIVEYADWSLRQFIKLASKQAWFDNTIFMFVADHGAPLFAKYDIALNYFHVPLIIYAPKLLTNHKSYKQIGSQIDIFPTIMGLIKQNYINNTLGIDLLSENRKYAVINDDDKIGILDTTFLCIMKDNGKKLELYKYRNHDKHNYFSEHKNKAKEMADFAKANMQIHQNMILKKTTSLNE